MFDIKNLNDEYFANLNPEEVLEVKGLTTEEKVQCFKYFLDSEVITNVSVISNIFMLINGITGIDDVEMKDERVFFNSLEEYVDIKLQIRYELDDFNTWLLEYYLGIIQGLSVTLDELKVHIPNTFFCIMPLISLDLISKLMVKYLKRVNAEKVKPAFHAAEMYSRINNTDSLIFGFLQNLAGETK